MAMDSTLIKAFRFALSFEGSKYEDDPRDPGGPTKHGIALNFSRKWIPDKNNDGKIDKKDVMLLEVADAMEIYRNKYWIPCKCSQLPDVVAFQYCDACFNIGEGAAPKLLQYALNDCGANLKTDGKVGPLTINAAVNCDKKKFVKAFYDQVMARYRSRVNWPIYGKGWSRRATACYNEAKKMLGMTVK